MPHFTAASVQSNIASMRPPWAQPRIQGEKAKASPRDGPGSPDSRQNVSQPNQPRRWKDYSKYKQYELFNGALSAEDIARQQSRFDCSSSGSSARDEPVSHYGIFQSKIDSDDEEKED